MLAALLSGVIEATANLRRDGHLHIDAGLWIDSFVVWLPELS